MRGVGFRDVGCIAEAGRKRGRGCQGDGTKIGFSGILVRGQVRIRFLELLVRRQVRIRFLELLVRGQICAGTCEL